MIIVAGHLVVAPEGRAAYLDECAGFVERARGAPGCLDFAIAADLVDPGRVDVYERWGSREAANAFRSTVTGGGQDDVRVRGAWIFEYDVADERCLT